MVDVVWDLEDDPQGNVQHIAEHGVSPRMVEQDPLVVYPVTAYEPEEG